MINSSSRDSESLLIARARGSKTAIDGFNNESDVANKFNSWKSDLDAQEWLEAMNYKLKDIEKVVARKVKGHYKADIQVQVTIYFKELIDAQNISIKLVSNPSGFNQIDKRWVSKYESMWSIPPEICSILRQFTGEVVPKVATRDPRRTFLDEISRYEQNLIVDFFTKNKTLVIADIIKGREPYSAAWFLVVLKTGDAVEWKLADINSVLNLYSQGDVRITNRGSLKIGRVTMQRKGGDGGRDTAKMLQFKLNPVDAFTI